MLHLIDFAFSQEKSYDCIGGVCLNAPTAYASETYTRLVGHSFLLGVTVCSQRVVEISLRASWNTPSWGIPGANVPPEAWGEDEGPFQTADLVLSAMQSQGWNVMSRPYLSPLVAGRRDLLITDADLQIISAHPDKQTLCAGK